MEAPPLLVSRNPNQQVILAVVVPATFGFICGILLGISEPAYLILSVLAIAGGIGAGYEHETGSEGAGRGVAGGMLFGTFILFGNALAGAEPKADLPEPHVLLVILTTTLGVAFGAIGGTLRARHERRAHPVQLSES